MQRGLLLDVVVGESAAVRELQATKDQALLVGRDPLFVLDLGFDVFNRVGRFDVQRDGLAGQRFDEDLTTTAETKQEVKCGLFLDVVFRQRAAIFENLASKNQALLVGRDALPVLNLGLDIFNGVGRFDVQLYGLARQCFEEDLYCEFWPVGFAATKRHCARTTEYGSHLCFFSR